MVPKGDIAESSAVNIYKRSVDATHRLAASFKTAGDLTFGSS